MAHPRVVARTLRTVQPTSRRVVMPMVETALFVIALVIGVVLLTGRSSGDAAPDVLGVQYEPTNVYAPGAVDVTDPLYFGPDRVDCRLAEPVPEICVEAGRVDPSSR